MNREEQSTDGFSSRRAIRALPAVWLLFALLWVPGMAGAQLLSVEETESLVRAVYFEGMPPEEAERIGPEGCARLVEMLSDSSERAHHGQILVAIGICRPAGGFEAIRDWANTPREGEIDRATFRSWQALPFALGYLARRDPRALALLEARLNDPAAPRWTFRHHRGARLVSQGRRAAATSLAMTGTPEAGRALERAEERATDPAFRSHLQGARAMHRRSGRRPDAPGSARPGGAR